mmetsp:Transcript_4173/g.6967  ORF Transcript_4173/g.6967 Transcript_4173/m.6967 type:complete len:86 (-) Transcript_4173:1044-1301(-)
MDNNNNDVDDNNVAAVADDDEIDREERRQKLNVERLKSDNPKAIRRLSEGETFQSDILTSLRTCHLKREWGLSLPSSLVLVVNGE